MPMFPGVQMPTGFGGFNHGGNGGNGGNSGNSGNNSAPCMAMQQQLALSNQVAQQAQEQMKQANAAQQQLNQMML